MRTEIVKFFKRYSFEHLLLWFMLYLVVGPFLINTAHAGEIITALMSGTLFAAAYALHMRSKLFTRAKGNLLIITLILLWVENFKLVTFSATSSYLLLACYLCFIIYSFTGHIIRARCITTSLISATLCLYLLIGLLWGNIYALLNHLSPGSFNSTFPIEELDNIHYFIYFSFVTLTTLGYGDILPQTPGARALCHVEAIVGQFFMAVAVARLVGIQVTQQFSGINTQAPPDDCPARQLNDQNKG